MWCAVRGVAVKGMGADVESEGWGGARTSEEVVAVEGEGESNDAESSELALGMGVAEGIGIAEGTLDGGVATSPISVPGPSTVAVTAGTPVMAALAHTAAVVGAKVATGGRGVSMELALLAIDILTGIERGEAVAKDTLET